MEKEKLFKPNFESLKKHKYPKWFRDGKFGIWSHWGPQSVPMSGDWYARNMYIQGTEQYRHHLRHYGHPSKHGYKYICKLWKAENFEPEKLMDLYVEAGAKYFVGQAMHHDHFFNYPSKYNRFNSMEVGPKKDICGMWQEAAKKHDLPFGLTEHLGASFSWWKVNKGSDSYGPYKDVPYDGNDEEYRDFYFDNYEHVGENGTDIKPWYTSNEKFHEYWLNVIKEVIDIYEPDFLYSDGALPFGNIEESKTNSKRFQNGLEAVSYLYNKSIEKHGSNRAVYLQKDARPEIYKVGVLDVEKSQLEGISEEPWHTDTCIGNWFYDANAEFKKPGHIIEILVDIVSKNGSMLLNVLQRPDGTIDEETEYILKELGKWFKTCAEGIYETRPWRVWSEGVTRVNTEGFKEAKTNWTSSDFRFTKKDNTVYSFILEVPKNKIVTIKSFNEDDKIKNVRLLGKGDVPFDTSFGVLTVKLPENLPTEYVNCLAVELEK